MTPTVDELVRAERRFTIHRTVHLHQAVVFAIGTCFGAFHMPTWLVVAIAVVAQVAFYWYARACARSWA